MGIRIAWTDSNTAEDGYNVYRHTASMAGLTDTQLASYLVATLPADATEYKDGTAVDGTTYFYLVATRSGSVLVPGTEVEVTAAQPAGQYPNAQIGDYIGGGIYAGDLLIDGTNYKIIFGLADSDSGNINWKTSNNETPGTESETDGLANTQAIIAAGLSDHPAAEHCVNYAGGGFNDWYLPSLEELKLHTNLAGNPELENIYETRWTSTQVATTTYRAWIVAFHNNSITESNKTGFYQGRPVRRVPA